MRGQWIKNEQGEFEYNEFWNGFSAKHYWLEHQSHKEFYDFKYPTPKEAEKIIKKIRRHFKLGFGYVFNGHTNGHATMVEVLHIRSGRIYLPKENISLGIICHEIAHILTYKKWKKNLHHTKKFQTQCNRICRWAKRYLPEPIL